MRILAGSLSEDVLAERELKRYVVNEMAAFAGRFTERLESARKTGELPSDFDAEVAAQVLVTYLQGLFRKFSLPNDRLTFDHAPNGKIPTANPLLNHHFPASPAPRPPAGARTPPYTGICGPSRETTQ